MLIVKRERRDVNFKVPYIKKDLYGWRRWRNFLSLSLSLSLESFGVSSKEYKSIVETIKPAEKAKRITQKEDDKMKITK